MRFEILEHPADIGFRARGATLEELFAECAFALVSIVFDPSDIRPARSIRLAAEGHDIEALLVNWLNEVLYQVDGRGMALGAFNVRIEPGRVQGAAHGEPRDPGRHPPKLIVKAVTYHQLKVAPTPAGWVAEVYLDI